MAVSVVQICNMALARIGISDQIASLTESSNEATQCNLFYEPTRDRVLRDHQWPFARKYQALALIEEADEQAWADQWSYAYRYPSDCLMIHRITTAYGRRPDESIPFEVGQDDAGRVVYTDQEDAVIVYTRRVTDTSHFDPMFVSALAWLLAVDIALPLAASESLRERAGRAYMMELATARAHAANEQRRDPEPDSEFIRARE